MEPLCRHALVREPEERRTHHELNILLLRQLHHLAWSRIRTHHARLQLGLKWRDEIEVSGACAPSFFVDTCDIPGRMTRERIIEIVVKYAWWKTSGVLPRKRDIPREVDAYNFNARYVTHKNDPALSLLLHSCLFGKTRDWASLKHLPPITYREITEYLWPGGAYVALFMPLFAIAQINASSLCELACVMLTDDVADPRRKWIRWEKQRSGGELLQGPFSVGGSNAPTLPRAWELLRKGTSCIRHIAGEELRDRLCIWFGRMTNTNGPVAVKLAMPRQFTEYFRPIIKESDEPEFALLRSIADSISLKLIRTTAINITHTRLNGHSRQTAVAVRHKGRGSLENSYLNNNQVKSDLETEIARGVEFIFDWVTSPPAVIPATERSISKRTGASKAEARAALAEKFNLGFGVSLVRGNAVVIDTPLNCLRMMQWLRKILGAENRVRSSNPNRWERVWEPQVKVFSDALEDFPRSTRAAAEALDADFDLPFPEVW